MFLFYLSTQIKLLNQALNKLNIKSEIISFPNRQTSIGKLLDNYLTKRNKSHSNFV